MRLLPCFLLLLPQSSLISVSFFQLHFKSLGTNLDTLHTPPQSLRKSCWLYLQNISRHQPILTIFTVSSLAQAATSLAWIISITLLISLPPFFSTFSLLNTAAKVIQFKFMSDHVSSAENSPMTFNESKSQVLTMPAISPFFLHFLGLSWFLRLQLLARCSASSSLCTSPK